MEEWKVEREPSQAASQLEGSMGFTKDLCREANIPTGAYGRFTSAADALAYVRKQGAPIVVKADGLAAGKGVVVAKTLDEADAAIATMFDSSIARVIGPTPPGLGETQPATSQTSSATSPAILPSTRETPTSRTAER